MGASEYAHLEFEEIRAESEKAFLVRFADGEQKWIPFSVVADADDYNKGDGPGTISVAEWFASKERLA